MFDVLPCIVCGAELDLMPTGMPRRGVEFSAVGHFESGAFDGGPESLEVNVCDECLVRAGEQYRVWYSEQRHGRFIRRFWHHDL